MTERDLNTIAVFATMAKTHNFRLASERLGVTRSAVSQTIAKLEQALGTTLLHRTTRSVTLTEAGEHFLARVAPALEALADAVVDTVERQDRPRGQLRLAVSSIAEAFIDGPLLAAFVRAYPEVSVDVTVTDEEFDIVARGYDAGVQLDEVLDGDMIAVPVTGDQRQLVVAAPEYLARRGTPADPRELAAHACIGWRRLPELEPYHWDFRENGRDFRVQVPTSLTTNDMWLMLRTALAGGGLTFGMRDSFAPYLAEGRLVPLLEDFCPPFPGFFLYFPQRAGAAPKLRALIDHVHRLRGSGAGLVSCVNQAVPEWMDCSVAYPA